MGLNITFYLGKGSAKLGHRALKIWDVTTEPRSSLYDTNLAGTDETVTIELPENRLLQAVKTDYCVGGRAGLPEVMNFATDVAGIQFRSGELKVIGIEETSSSSSLSSSSSSSSSSLSSSSSSLSSSTSSGTSMSSSSSSSLSSSSTSTASSGSSSTSSRSSSSTSSASSASSLSSSSSSSSS